MLPIKDCIFKWLWFPVPLHFYSYHVFDVHNKHHGIH